MRPKLRLGALLLGWGLASGAQALDYYIYPIREIEGLGLVGRDRASRPLIDPKIYDFFPADIQDTLQADFRGALAGAYPQSIVHASQVRDIKKGSYAYLSDGVACGQGSFTVPINAAYAVALGVTRASIYQVDKGGNVEILVPVTLNVQVIKAERSKLAYVASSTHYTTIVIKKEELGLKSTSDLLMAAVLGNTRKQMLGLVDEVRTKFNPQQTPVKLLHKVQDYWIADKGYSAGFVDDDEVEAHDVARPDQEALIFKVISTGRNYAVLKASSGTPQAGGSYQFDFSSLGSDHSKPSVMPVYSMTPEGTDTFVAADLFSRNLGFDAPFTLAPVDMNFAGTLTSVRQQANCAPWDKYPESRKVFDSRTDAPKFFIRFGVWNTPLFVQTGAAGINSEEKFGTLVAGTMVDKSGNVIYSELGTDQYSIKRTSGTGLALANAREIAVKNAVTDLGKRFLANVKFDNKDYIISDVQAGQFTVQGLALKDGQDITFDVLHPLGIKAGKEDVVVKLRVAQDGPAREGPQGTVFTYQNIDPVQYPAVSKGDILRVIAASKPGAPDVGACGAPTSAAGSLPGEFLTPVIENAIHHAANYNIQVGDRDFYSAANALLKNGFYKFRMNQPEAPASCFKSTYALKVSERNCNGGHCAIKTTLGLRATIQGKNGVLKDAIFGESALASGVQEGQVENLAGYQALQSSINVASELLKRLNAK